MRATGLQADRIRDADKLLAVMAAIYGLYALVVAFNHSRLVLACSVVVPVFGLMVLRLQTTKWDALMAFVPPLSMCALSVLQAALVNGSYVAHAGLFVALCTLVIYEDWRRVVLVGAVLVVSRVVASSWFDDQAPGLAFSSLPPVVGDVVVLLMLTVILALYTRVMARRTAEHIEMDFLVRAMGKDGPIRLNLDAVRVHSPVGLRLKDVQTRMAHLLRQVREVIFEVHGAANEMSTSSQELLDRTQSTHIGLNDAAMSLEQINVIVQESARASREARSYANQASMMAGHGGEQVQQVVSAMREIDVSSRRITDIIGVIDSIAFQTNILALNAAVEAARAGEQGRGFAVVAAEVRMLAKRSSEAAREIKALIGESVTSVERGTKLADEAGKAMTELVEAVKRVGGVFETLTADSSEHAQGIDVVTSSMRELDEVTRQNVTVADRSGEMAHQLQQQAAILADVLSSFRLGDDAAVDQLRQEAAAAVERMAAQREAAAHRAKGGAETNASSSVDFF
jgi:methyl-accepting chemotaxis protein